ncbi:MAG: hypothetical protein QXQ66_09960, partial [Candidatus Hadarchaeum sp.]
MQAGIDATLSLLMFPISALGANSIVLRLFGKIISDTLIFVKPVVVPVFDIMHYRLTVRGFDIGQPLPCLENMLLPTNFPKT